MKTNKIIRIEPIESNLKESIEIIEVEAEEIDKVKELVIDSLELIRLGAYLLHFFNKQNEKRNSNSNRMS